MTTTKTPIKIDIIILSFAKDDLLKNMTEQTVRSILNSEHPSKIHFNIIIIESNDSLSPFQYEGTKTIYPNTKFGYHKFMNIGINLTENQYICICNNDLLFEPHWATQILNAFEDDNTLVSASPICSIHHPKVGISVNSGIRIGYEVRKEIAGWCLFFKRTMLQKTGLLDEKFTFWYADNDYASTLEKHNLKHALVTTSVVNHLESKTLATFELDEQMKMTTRERFYYEYKWKKRGYFSYLNRLFKAKRERNKLMKKLRGA
ncbi:glycosyltransferase family 2 protein [Pedobacter sp. AW1-32]|uniref:glycosyltransferase family 2 protein n=1 Tax=Pedobacter sp. AW1-32 TaxID=3383026 RepID=UPI003FF0BC02